MRSSSNSRGSSSSLVRAALALAAWATGASFAAPAVRYEFLLDDTALERWQGVEWVLGAPARRPDPVVAQDRPWEGDGLGFFSVLFDEAEGKFKAWYRARCPAAPGDFPASSAQSLPAAKAAALRHFLCYAESADGIRWTKPALRRVSFRGSVENNIVRESPAHDTVFYNILKDPHDPDPRRRYKALGYDDAPRSNLRGQPAGGTGVCVAYSADGLEWSDPPLLVMEKSDVTDADCILPERDPQTGDWVAFFRPRTSPKRRYIGHATSRDFERWTHPRMLLAPEAADGEWTEFYGVAVRPIGGWRIGALWVLNSHPAALTMTNELIYARDGYSYRRAAPRQALVPFGPAGKFDGTMVMPYALIERAADVLIYYRGTSAQHAPTRTAAPGDAHPTSAHSGSVAASGIGLAILPWGHFRGLRTAGAGTVETKWLANYGAGGISVIADIQPGGSIAAELVNVTGEVIPGWGRAESRHQPGERGTLSLHWNRKEFTGSSGQVSVSGGKVGHVIKLRFHLDRATLYGFRVGDSASTPAYKP